MSILQKASRDIRQRVLDLFPVANLRAGFSLKGTKESICRTAALSQGQAQINLIAKFVDTNLNVCKQHVYIFSHQGDAALPETILQGECVLNGVDHALYMVRTEYRVLVTDPLGKATLDFLWPIRIEITSGHLIVRFVVLEKNPSSYFDSPIIVRGRSVDEDAIIADIKSPGTLSPADINKGIKALWSDDYFDATRTRYKKTGSVAWEAMDEERGIKQFNPALYAELQNKPMYSTAFKGKEGGTKLHAFSADPTNGIIGFTQYSKEGGDSDGLIRQVLKNN